MSSLLATVLRRLRKQPQRVLAYSAAAVACTLLLRLRSARSNGAAIKIVYAAAPVSMIFKAIEAGNVQNALVTMGECICSLATGEHLRATLLPEDATLLRTLLHRHGVTYAARGPPGWRSAFVLMVPFAYLGVCGWLLHRMTNGDLLGGGSDPGTSSGAANDDDDDANGAPAIGWKDVAGIPEIKHAVMEVVDMIHRPEHYARLGAKCPRGVLLAGPPGTGKTLLAKAIASEAGVPFICCAGSDFVEVFVGRGARRVRNLFEEASRRAPCVLFIDELDALGSSRSLRGGGEQEHDQTLNQLLAMMDGVNAASGVLVVGATNRLASLDPALTRPGRFDRVLRLQLPDDAARLAILLVHASKTSIDNLREVLPKIAEATRGFSGADLAHVINEGAIAAVREREPSVQERHLMRAVAEFKASRADALPNTTFDGGGGGNGGGGGDGTGGNGEDMMRYWAQVSQMLQNLPQPGGGAPGTNRRRPARSASGGGSGIEENE